MAVKFAYACQLQGGEKPGGVSFLNRLFGSNQGVLLKFAINGQWQWLVIWHLLIVIHDLVT